MLVSLKDDESKTTETVWELNGCFNVQRSELAIKNSNLPENTLVYVNNGSISTVKCGHAIYLEL